MLIKKFIGLVIITATLIVGYSIVNPLSSAPINVYKKRIKTESDTVSATSLTSVDLNKYLGKKVSLFLNDPVIGRYKRYAFLDGKPGTFICVRFEYSPHLYLNIYVKKLKYTKEFDMNMGWKLDTFKKETISEIRIVRVWLIIKDTNKKYENHMDINVG